MRPYQLADWYWFVGGDESRAYYSAATDYVPADDPAFVAFLADSNRPTKIDTEFNLGAVLGELPVELAPTPRGILDGYTAFVTGQAGDDPAWVNHENRLRAIEAQLGINDAPALTSEAEAVQVRAGMLREFIEANRSNRDG
jgi:hypothetical protein